MFKIPTSQPLRSSLCRKSLFAVASLSAAAITRSVLVASKISGSSQKLSWQETRGSRASQQSARMQQQASLASTLPYPERYEAAVRYTELSAGKGLPQDVQLMLYALKKQVSEGPCTSAHAPGFFNMVENTKYQAWKQLGNMSVMEAMRLYVRTVEEERPDWLAAVQAADVGVGTATSQGGPGSVAIVQAQQADGQHDGKAEGVAANVVSYAKADAWSTVATLAAQGGKRPCPRYEHGAAILAGKLYVVGGNYAGRYLSDVWRLDLSTSQWELVSPSGLASASSQSTLQQAPSASPQQTEGEQEQAKDLDRKDQAGGTPTAGLLAPVAGHTVTPWDGGLLLLGGHTKAKTAAAAGSLPVRMLDPASPAAGVSPLETIGTVPAARGGHSATLLGGSLWVFGGEDATRKPLDDLHCLDLSSLSWQEPNTRSAVETASGGPRRRGAPPRWPAPRSAHSAVAYLDRYIIVFGGGSTACCFADCWVLDTAAGDKPSWVQASLQGQVMPRAGHSAVVCGDLMYVIGGGNNVKGCTDLLAVDLAPLKQYSSTQPSSDASSPPSVTLAVHTLASSPARDPLSSEGVSLLLLPSDAASEPVLIAFGGYNGKYHNVVNVLKAPQLPVSDASQQQDAAVQTTPKTKTPQQPQQNGSAHTGSDTASKQVATAPSKPLSEVDVLKSDVIRLKAALTAAQAEAEAAVKECAAATSRDSHEMALVRKQLATAQAALETAQKGLEDSRSALARESSRVLRLEAEVAELRHQLNQAADERKELEALRRQVKDAEMTKSKSGIWGYLSGQ